MTYTYRILSKSEDFRRERDEKSRLELDLAFIAAEIASMMCKIKCPSIRFIVECDDGYITRNDRIDGYSHNHKEIFLRSGMPPARTVEIALHEARHCWQWSQPRWAGRSDEDAERDAKLFVLEFWGTRRVETDPEKILPQLCEIGAPLAMSVGDEQAAWFYVEELKAARHPAAARLDKQYLEWCRIRERAENPRNYSGPNHLPIESDKARAARDHYYNVVLPKIASTYYHKPHLRVFEGVYPWGK
jgi:hypothetical protein